MESDSIRILLVDDHPIVRGGIAKYIEKEKGLLICGEAESANEAIRLINDTKPDVVIVDLSLKGDIDGIGLIKAIRVRYPKIHTLVLSIFEESVYAERAIRAGAKGYLQKSVSPDKIILAIHNIMDGKLYLSKNISDRMISKIVHGSSDNVGTNVDLLTDREFEIFQMIGNGYGTKEIAKRLNLSPHTIESHRKKIKEKISVRSTADLTKTAVQWIIAQNKNFGK